MYHQFRELAGVDITKEAMEVGPTCHYIMGGVRVDADTAASSVPGLYAAGEVACVSVHGGNRLGANSLLDTLVFGRRAGQHAAHAGKSQGMPSPSKAALEEERRMISDLVQREGSGRRVSELKAELGSTMDKYCAVFRDEDGLRTALDTVRRLKEEVAGVAVDDKGTVFNQDVLGALELKFMIENAEAIVISAIERKESRGAQYRTDFPERNDDDWLKHINVAMNGAEPEISYSEVTLTQWEPEERKY
jgi:succinate dehydrogenase / fumarate reductase flavoprotein subunit